MNRTRSRHRLLRREGLLGTMLLGALGTGCETYFVDPTPPELSVLKREQKPGQRDTPLVYGFIFDLDIPDATECARIKSQLMTTLRATLLPPGREGLELSPQDFSPDCARHGYPSFPPYVYDQMLRSVAERFGTRQVKPVFFYFNNVELPLPVGLSSDLSQLQRRSTNPPQIWALTTPDVQSTTSFAQSASWTYSADTRLTAKLEELIRAKLPFVEREPPPAAGFALFTPEELSWVRAFKGCTHPSNLSGVDFTYGGGATAVDPARPPHFTLTFAAQDPVPRDQPPSLTPTRFSLEVCRDHCERLAVPSDASDPVPVAWSTTPRCFLAGY